MFIKHAAFKSFKFQYEGRNKQYISILLVVLLTGWKLDGEGEGRIASFRKNLRVPDLVQAINAAAGLTIKIRLLDLPGRQHTNYTDKLVYPVITLVATLQHPLCCIPSAVYVVVAPLRTPIIYLIAMPR